MRGHLPASRATKRQRRRPENEPRYCRARRRPAHWSAKASASSARCLRSSAPDAASILRLASMSLARAFHTSPPSQNGTAAACHTRRHRTRHALEICIGQRLSHGARRLACGGRIGPPRPNRLVSCLLGGFRNWFGFLERRVAILHIHLDRRRARSLEGAFVLRRRVSWLMRAWLTYAYLFSASDFLRIFCRFLRGFRDSRIPFKYICSFQINHNTALARVRQPCWRSIFVRKINTISPLKVPLRRTAYNGARKGDARYSRLSAQTSKR